ncbi:MAG: glycosyltransferase [Candidatus Rokubacteria bacterium]|nr:glycosyltransferase [Candidatus Rokubacteria bacterium]
MSRIRILFVLTQAVRGGAEEVVLALLNRLDPLEFEPALACPETLLDAMPEVRLMAVETFRASAESWVEPREVSKLAAGIRRFRPHLVNPHLFRSTLVAAPLAKWLGVPRVVETYHGREAWRRGPIKGSFLVDRIVSHWVDRVIAVSEAARDFLVRAKRIRPSKVVVVPNGRDLSLFKPGMAADGVRQELGLEPHVPVVGVVGRLEPQKGHLFVLDAFPSVLAELPEARLLIVGDGSLRRALEGRAARLGISGRVLFTGFRTDVPRLLDAMDLAVLPSLFEGMPLTAIEAAAMARPVVATRVDGTPEVVRDGITGRLVPPGDPVALGEAIRALLHDPSGARRMGEAGRARVLARFDLQAQVEATARVYREVVTGAA